MGYLRPLAVAAVLVAGACALPSADEYTSPARADETSDAGPGGGPTDGRVIGPGTDGETLHPPGDHDGGADAATVVNLLSKNASDFELNNDCDGAGTYEATLTSTNTAHGGAYACNVCRIGSPEIWSIDTGFDTDPAPGQIYRATAWVRRPPGSTETITIAIALRTERPDYSHVEEAESEPLVLTDAWQQASIELPLTKSAPRMDTYLYALNTAQVNGCFLIDDYVVWRTQ